jgi:hypothetical protein
LNIQIPCVRSSSHSYPTHSTEEEKLSKELSFTRISH